MKKRMLIALLASSLVLSSVTMPVHAMEDSFVVFEDEFNTNDDEEEEESDFDEEYMDYSNQPSLEEATVSTEEETKETFDEEPVVSENTLEVPEGYEALHGKIAPEEEIDYGTWDRTNGSGETLDNAGASYSSKYDPRDYNAVTSVKSQIEGTCWVYGSIATAEQSLIKEGFANSSIDLSEFHPIYYNANGYIDRLGNYTVNPHSVYAGRAGYNLRLYWRL